MDDVPILEFYSSKRAAHLSAELNVVDRRKLAEEAQPRIKLAHERLAHGHLREWRSRRRGIRAAYGIRVSNPCNCNGCGRSCGSSPKLAPRRSCARPFSLIGARLIDGFAHSPPHKIGEIHSRGSSKTFDPARLYMILVI
jgi:hypothetical protein